VVNKDSKIFIAGHKGMVGSAILKKLNQKGFRRLYVIDRDKLDLRDQTKVFDYLRKVKPDGIIIAAATVGGINANNTFKADFIYNNLSIQNNLIHGGYLNKVKNLIFLGSSCVYPKESKQPIKEEYLLSNYLEKTNEPYAIAKIAGIKMCSSYNFQYNLNYKCLMPCNSYGINDNYDSKTSHFLPALIKKIHKLKTKNLNNLILWGNGKAKREFIHVDDLAAACIYFMKKKTKHSIINIGTGKDYTIDYYANFISKIILNKSIKIKYDKSKPDGVKRKVLDISLAKNYGWKPKIDLKNSIIKTYNSYLKEMKK